MKWSTAMFQCFSSFVDWYFDFKINNVEDAIFARILGTEVCLGTPGIVGYSVLISSRNSLNKCFYGTLASDPDNQICVITFPFNCVHTCAKVCERKSVDNFWETGFSLYLVGPEVFECYRLGAGVFTCQPSWQSSDSRVFFQTCKYCMNQRCLPSLP